MSKIRIKGDTSGHVDLETSATGSNLSISSNTTVSGNATVGGTLGVTGATTISGGFETNNSTGTTFSSNSYNIVKIQTDKDDNAAADGLLQFTHGSANTVKGEIRYDASESMFELGHGDNQGHIRINASGHVTMPNTPYFSVYVNNGGSGNPGSGGGLVSVPFDGAEFNVGNHFNTSNYRFTAPIDGLYQFNWTLSIYNVAVGSWLRQRTFKNGSSYQIYEYKYSQTGADQNLASSFAYKLDQNDYIEFYANSSDTSFTYSAGLTWNSCTGYLIG